jgi:hypothetical protein
MIQPHVNVDFKFNEESMAWLDTHCPAIIDNFDRTYPEAGGPIFKDPIHSDTVAFQTSPPAVQLTNFLSRLGLPDTYIQMFVYKIESKTISIENPHIDSPGFNRANTPWDKPLPGRFNVLVYGNENSKMHWWNIGMDHDMIEYIETDTIKRWQVIGNTAKEKFDLIGPADYSTDKLSKKGQSGDFVRSEVAHCIERDGERRLIVSARIHHPWEEILEKTKNV